MNSLMLEGLLFGSVVSFSLLLIYIIMYKAISKSVKVIKRIREPWWKHIERELNS